MVLSVAVSTLIPPNFFLRFNAMAFLYLLVVIVGSSASNLVVKSAQLWASVRLVQKITAGNASKTTVFVASLPLEPPPSVNFATEK